MRWMLFVGTLSVASLVGCASTPSAVNAHEQDYLSIKRVAASVNRQASTWNSDQAIDRHIRELRSLQDQADILLFLSDELTVQVSHARIANQFPTGPFPISDLQKYLPASEQQRINLAVVVTPSIFPVRPGKPDEIELIRIFDNLLRQAGVQRRVFEIVDNMHYLKLDSAESD